MKSRRARAGLVLLAASLGMPASLAAPVQIRTETLTAKGTGDFEKPFSLRMKTDVLSATGMEEKKQPDFKPLRIETTPLYAAGEAPKPAGGKK